MTKSKSHRPIRHLTERVLDVVLMKGRVAGLSYRFGGHGRLKVVREELTVGTAAQLPRPLRIGFASDFHAGPTTDPAIFDDLLAALRRERPDVLLLGGDYVSFDAANVHGLSAYLTAYAQTAPLAAALPAPFGAVSVCGIDDPWTGAPSAQATFAGAAPGTLRLYLMHSPDGLWHLDGLRYDVGFAGHTHGGQIARRGGAQLFRPSGPYSRRYSFGRFDIPDNGPLFVSRGIGCAGIPLRLNADPELLICTLRAAA
jgi:predicted MPP superfamily phosphohydrolase